MLRFGVIGTNWITESFIEAARATGEAEVTAVLSRTAERAEAFAAKWDLPHRYTELEALAGSGDIDAVYIASPNASHAEQAIACMREGKHVLCEKPIAANAREVRAMIEQAGRSGVLLMEAVKSTLQPNFAAVMAHLPTLGQVRRYTASYGQYSSRYDAYKQGTVLNAFNPKYANGALMDLGVYCLYPLAILFGRPQRVQANALMLGSGVDGQGSILLTYPAMEAVIHYSKIADSALPSEIQGEEGTLVIDRINRMQQVELRYRNGTVKDVSRPQTEPAMAYEVREFARLVAEGRTEGSSINSLESSLVTMEIMDEVRRQIGLVYPSDRAEAE